MFSAPRLDRWQPGALLPLPWQPSGAGTRFRGFFSPVMVLNGTSLRLAASNEFDACSEWQALWRAHGTELVLCVSACHQRGILGAEEAARHGRTGASLAEGFIVAGLGQLAELTAVADRVVTFG